MVNLSFKWSCFKRHFRREIFESFGRTRCRKMSWNNLKLFSLSQCCQNKHEKRNTTGYYLTHDKNLKNCTPLHVRSTRCLRSHWRFNRCAILALATPTAFRQRQKTINVLLIKQFCAHKEILYENMDYLWHNRYVALQSGVLMKMYRERQFLGLFTVHYHYRTENRDSSVHIWYQNKQPKITTLLFDLFNEKDMETKDVQHACSGSTRLPQTAHLHDVNCQPGLVLIFFKWNE